MPELPDVEGYRKYFEETSLNKKIKDISVFHKKSLKGISPAEFREILVGKKFTSSLRYGKYLFGITSKHESVVMHFGMTGFLVYYKKEEDASSHIRVQFDFSDKSHLGFDCMRMFGKVSYTPDYEQYIRDKDLGRDPIVYKMSYKEFQDIIDDRSSNVKVFLMDQSILAGIGNEMSDEILFQAAILPGRTIDSLSKEENKALFRSINKTLTNGIKYAQKGKYPDDYLINYRKAGKECPVCGGEIKKSTIGGRSSYYCRKHQK
jgi:formamidopyrimidine-DNA glycosylase